MFSPAMPSLMFYALIGDAGAVHELIPEEPDLDQRDCLGETALMAAAMGNHECIAKMLLAAGAPVDSANNDGETALMMAARLGYPGMVQLLLDAGAEVDRSCFLLGRTALMHAARHGHAGVVDILTAAGAHPNRCDHTHHTPLTLAARQGYSEIVRRMLMSFTASSTSSDTKEHM